MVGGQKHLTYISKISHIKNHEQSFPKEDRIKENEHKLQEELFEIMTSSVRRDFNQPTTLKQSISRSHLYKGKNSYLAI